MLDRLSADIDAALFLAINEFSSFSSFMLVHGEEYLCLQTSSAVESRYEVGEAAEPTSLVSLTTARWWTRPPSPHHDAAWKNSFSTSRQHCGAWWVARWLPNRHRKKQHQTTCCIVVGCDSNHHIWCTYHTTFHVCSSGTCASFAAQSMSVFICGAYSLSSSRTRCSP